MSPWGPVRRSDVSSPVCPTFFRPWWLEGYGGWWCCTTRALCSVAGIPEEPLLTMCMGVIKKNMSSWTGRAQGKNVTLSHHQLWLEWKKGPLLLACRGVLICLGCCSKILLAEWFMGNRRLFHTILKVGSWKSGCQQTWYLKRTHFLLHKQCLLSA